jgi:hypothetical protein
MISKNKAVKPSRYNIFVPLREGRMLAYNGFSGALAVWEKQEQETYEFLSNLVMVVGCQPKATEISDKNPKIKTGKSLRSSGLAIPSTTGS